MKKLYHLFLLMFFSFVAHSQPHGNEWIPFSIISPVSLQHYLKIQVWQEGIHRISFNDINQYLPQIVDSSVSPKRFQVFHKGIEQYIYVFGEDDNTFDNTDYVEFYAKPNDGSFDTQLYDSAQYQLNPFYSLFNDTSAYFFTYTFNPVGKRMVIENDINFSLYNPADFVIKDVRKEYHSEYFTGYAELSVDASYSNGEGFSYSPPFDGSSSFSINLPTLNSFTGGGAPPTLASTLLLGTNYGGNPAQRQWTITVNTQQAISYSYYNYAVNRYEVAFNLSGTSIVFLFSPDVPSSGQRNTVPYARAIYPHTLNFSGENSSFQKFTVKGDAALKTRLDISGFNTVDTAWLYIFSGDSIKKVNVDFSSHQTLVPTYGIDKLCVLSSGSLSSGHSIVPVSNNPDPTRFTNYMYNIYNGGNNPDYDFLMISHKSLMNGVNPVQMYRDYRNSFAGGAHKVLLADIDELYNQFSAGINKHPLSIRNFCKFALDTFVEDPKYLFLIGKSIRPENARDTSVYRSNLVPTYGNPPSDMIFTSHLTDAIFHPAIATGRLPAWNSQDVTAYLDKIIEHDIELTKPPQAWMKQILHFGGGTNSSEQEEIRVHLEDYKKIIEDTLFAGHVTSFYKTTTDPIEANQSAFLQNLIDTGVTIMTFFSHAAGSTFDITTDVPENYNNSPRYPLIIANSCYIGDIHTGVRQASEQFVLIPHRGAIGFIASPNISYIPEQPIYTIPLYQHIASYDYGKSIGECMKDAIDSIHPGASSVTIKSLAMGMTLNGDPSLELYNMAYPDLEVTNPGVFFTPSDITTELDSFKINVVVRNLGRGIDKDYYLEVVRKFPDGGADRVFDTLIKDMPFIDTISITIPMEFARASGLNKFFVKADASQPGLIDEGPYEYNNSTMPDIPLLIRSSDINPVYPFKYAIIPNGTNVKLKASTANLFAPMTAYRFELDTIDRFNSPFKKTYDISSTGGVVTCPAGFSLDSNRVYYWRVANAAILNDTVHYHWKESSFIYKPGKTGWSQAHYSQFKEDEFRNIVYNNSMPPADTTFEFVETASSILCHTSVTPDQLGGHPVDYFINNNLMASGGCSFHQINLAILDSVTLVPWRADLTVHDLGNMNGFDPATGTCPKAPPNCQPGYAPSYFLYPTGDSATVYAYTDSLATAINSVPVGNYILIYLLGGSKHSFWHPALAPVFAALAPGTVPTNDDYFPFIYFTKKGSGFATIIYADTVNNKDITFDTIVGGNWNKGFITSVIIGPATHWSELHWGQHEFEPEDSIHVNLVGISTQNQETTLIANLPASIPDSSLSFIDAAVYPFLKLQSYHQDEPHRTPPQLDRWQIYYDEVPEAALAPNKWFKPNPFTDTTDEGAKVNLEMAVENISSHDMDSMLVDFYVYDKNHVRTNISSPRYKPLKKDSIIIAKVSFDTENFTGLNSLWIEANPHNDQPEQYHFNNLAELLFTVNRDITNPILDVTFDGQHILDGDIVSAKPFIFIKVKDENKYVAMNDTTKFPVRITDPEGKVSRVYFESAPNASTDRSKLKWTPAVLIDGNKPDNSFKIEYNPIFDVDGIYQLEVQGSDAAGNLSGAYSYRISFEVINRSTITDFINYPNPFSTATKFVFTLTGSEIPTYLKIQIMTVSGKIVREITQSEIGNIHIGRNITQYAWDGKDEFGDKLANGIYLYRVITQLNGQSIEHRETEADHFFKKGWGKMCLIR
ncbi:MAG TPA: C25 family cysteine peptidase [Bacteroidia bacterium]|nr:C25 family cysteine peptidase [Bacteroidia bacterium]